MNKGNEQATRKLIGAILKRGYTISVFDGEEITIRRCDDPNKIFEALDTTEEDSLILYKEGKRRGSFSLIYCNAEDGSEVIADHTANEICEEIHAEVTA